jgi:hypothetical protein
MMSLQCHLQVRCCQHCADKSFFFSKHWCPWLYVKLRQLEGPDEGMRKG